MFDFPNLQGEVHAWVSLIIMLISVFFTALLLRATVIEKSKVAERLRWAVVFLFAGITTLAVYRTWFFWHEKPEQINAASTAIDIFRFGTLLFFWWAWATSRPVVEKKPITRDEILHPLRRVTD